MRVSRTDLDDSPLTKLTALSSDPAAGIEAGEVLAYRCRDCGNNDETPMQVVHDAECPHFGTHGCASFPELESGIGTATPELQPDHPITIIRMGETDPSAGLHNGEPVGFRCDECGNSDETLSEIVHDELCSLAGRHGRQLLAGSDGARRVCTDGGDAETHDNSTTTSETRRQE